MGTIQKTAYLDPGGAPVTQEFFATVQNKMHRVIDTEDSAYV